MNTPRWLSAQIFKPWWLAAICLMWAATVAKAEPITEQQAHAIGVDAYLYFYPLVTMDLTRKQLTNVEGASGHLARFLCYDDRPCRVALEGLAERMERDDFVVGHLARRSLRARARGDGTGWERGAKVNWPSVCLSPSHGDGLSCVPHANTGVHSNMSVVSVQATVSFIITFRKRTSLYRYYIECCRQIGFLSM